MNNTKDMFCEAFYDLNDRLRSADMHLRVVCAGGYALSRCGLRTTKDVDGFFAETLEITRLIKETGDKYGLNEEDELWLNNSIGNLNRCPSEDICEIVYDLPNLTVLMPRLDYIAGMKLRSARDVDIRDAASIIRMIGAEDPAAFAIILRDLGFAGTDESLILEAFGTAYGMKWLEQYYIAHEDEILAML